MTVGPDDLPGAGAQQVICACMSEAFKVIISGPEIVAECLGCGSTANRFPSLAGLGPLAGAEKIIGPGRDTLPGGFTVGGGGGRVDWAGGGFAEGGPGISAGAAWGPGGGSRESQPMGEDEIRKAMEAPAPLPVFSPEIANTYLSGGPYDGQITWLMPDLTEFLVSGVQGKYVPDPDCEAREGRAVWRFVPSVQP